MPTIDAHAVTQALRAGPATHDALAARLGVADREQLQWALDDAVDRGWASTTAQLDCGPDGICGTAPPAIVSLTEAGREALRAATR